MAEHGTPDLISSRAPFIQALVQKSVTAITNPAGRLSFRMLRQDRATPQGVRPKKMAPRLRAGGKTRPRTSTDFTDFKFKINLSSVGTMLTGKHR